MGHSREYRRFPWERGRVFHLESERFGAAASASADASQHKTERQLVGRTSLRPSRRQRPAEFPSGSAECRFRILGIRPCRRRTELNRGLWCYLFTRRSRSHTQRVYRKSRNRSSFRHDEDMYSGRRRRTLPVQVFRRNRRTKPRTRPCGLENRLNVRRDEIREIGSVFFQSANFWEKTRVFRVLVSMNHFGAPLNFRYFHASAERRSEDLRILLPLSGVRRRLRRKRRSRGDFPDAATRGSRAFLHSFHEDCRLARVSHLKTPVRRIFQFGFRVEKSHRLNLMGKRFGTHSGIPFRPCGSR